MRGIRAEIKTTVNGKIDKLLKTVVTKDDFEEHKESIEPLLEIYHTASTGKRFILGTAKIIFWVAALILTVKSILRI